MTEATITACPTCGATNRIPAVASGRPRHPTCKADLPWLASHIDKVLVA